MPEMKRQKMVDLKDLLGDGLHLPTVVLNSLEKLLGLDRLNVAYDHILKDKENGSPENFFESATKHLGLKYQLRPGELDRIPRKGPVVVVANHPHGLSDGLMIGKLLTKVRDDVRIVANEQLLLCGELAPWMITVDVYDGADARMKNFAGIKQMISWLNKGGLIAIFPAGTASSYSIPDKHVTDDPWNNNIASIIRRTKATVVPLYIPGRTSLFFQGVSLIKREARVAFLPREVGRDSRCVHKIVIGKPISGASLNQYDSDQALISHLRLRTYLMGKNYDKSRRPGSNHHSSKKNGRKPDLITPIAPELLQAEISSLPESSLLHRNANNGWEVYLADAGQIPSTLREIGRLRELTFRAAGEGSGLACDLDEYDAHYKHLILWDSVAQKIAGAYRMGLTDEILDQVGIKGLYNGAFFSFSPKAIEVMRRGVEMGRAFIVPEYQKLPLALGTLWVGIGQFIVKHPQYRYLYGTVSISRDYTNLSRTLIVSYLEAKEMDAELALGVKAFNPPHRLRLQGPELRILPMGLTDPQGLSQMVADIEQDGKGLPVLLRHYLKLNGKILSFNIDKSFGDVLDCLILVDIYKSPERSLRRFMGGETYEELQPLIREALQRESSDSSTEA